MYKFVDTIEVSDGALLPSEALQLNGEYIENLIPGYRTLSVSGREALSPEIETYETGASDGSIVKSKRYPARIIIVKYQLIAEDAAAFRAAYNKLGGILDVEDAELIFNDENDKFFIGTPYAIGEVEPGKNAVIGEFEILCADPFKYSVEEYEVEPQNDGSFLIEYNGTYKSFPVLEAEFYKENEADGGTVNALTGNGDCGYVAFFNEDEKIIQLGDPDETDGENDTSIPKAQTLINQVFNKSSSWGAAAQSQWRVNDGVTSSGSVAQTGTLKMCTPVTNDGYCLEPASYGTGTAWHGPSITRTIPADALGETGAANFKLSWASKISCENLNGGILKDNFGAFQIQALSGNGSNRKIVAGVSVYKNSKPNNWTLRLYVNNKTYQTIGISLTGLFSSYYANSKTVAWCSIEKSGNKVVFSIGSTYEVKKYTAVCNDEGFAEMKANEITYAFSTHGNAPALPQNGLYGIKFVKNNCNNWIDTPNKFSANDIVTADCNTGEIYLNNVNAPELGALGNDWEEFCLKPGYNQIGMAYSDWLSAAYAPTFKLRYREVFL